MTSSTEFIAGASAACLSKACLAPINRVVVLMQAQAMLGNHTVRALDEARMMLSRDGGVTAFWRGIHATLWHRTVCSGIMFSCTSTNRREHASIWSTMATNTVASTVAVVLSHPLDVVKTRSVAETGRDTALHYQSTFKALRSIYFNEGLPGLSRGLGVSAMGTVPTIALNFTIYQKLRGLYIGPEPPPCWSIALAGAISGACATSIMFPLDLMKKQMQLLGRRGGADGCDVSLSRVAVREDQRPSAFFINHARNIYEQRGFRGFYVGLVPELAKVIPGVAVMFTANEWFRSRLPR